MKKRRKTQGQVLGMGESISRRDYLNSVLLASGGLLLSGASPVDLLANEDWDGYSGLGDYSRANGNTYEVMADGHKIRDHAFDPLPRDVEDTAEQFDCVVIGGGISGLAAALFFQHQTTSKRTCLVLENHPVFGGEARRNEFEVDGERLLAHQGSAMFFPPLPGTFLADFYRSIGIDTWEFPYQTWGGADPEIPLGRTSYTTGGETFGLYFGSKFEDPKGKWVIDPWGRRLDGAPISERTRRELLAMKEGADLPLPQEHGDALSRKLDTMTLEQHLMESHGLSRDTVRTFLTPGPGGGAGMGPDVLSAYAPIANRVMLPWDREKGTQMFPGGNAGVARHIVKELVPKAFSGANTMEDVCRSAVNFTALDRRGQRSRIRHGATVVAVSHEGAPGASEFVRVVYLKAGKLYSLRARAAILAGGNWTTKHIVKDLPAKHREAYAKFHRAPCLMANVAVRNWRFLYKLGISECQWFEGIGNYVALRKVPTFGHVTPTVSPDSPVVLTLKILYTAPGLPIADQVMRGRAELVTTPFRTYEQRIREQLSMLFAGSGFDARRDIAAIVLNRWGHAYLSAQPGFFFGKNGQPAPGEVLRHNPFGRMAFANSDLSGIMDHRTSILEARRAVDQVIDRMYA